jgi:hypothetical protein
VTPPRDAAAGGADATLFGLVHNMTSVPVHGLEVEHTSTAGVTNHRFLASFSDHMWIVDRPEPKRTLWSRTNWARSESGAGVYLNAFQIPATADAGDAPISIPQHDAPARPAALQSS